MKDFFQRNFFMFVAFCSYHIGKIHLPFSRKEVTGSDMRSLDLSSYQDGDLLLSYTNGELANVAIPGIFGHIGVIKGNKVIEAATTGVRKVDILDFVMTNKDGIVLLRPNFMTKEQIALMLQFCEEQIGKPYNYFFKFSEKNDRFYCTELAYKGLLHGNPNAPFTLRKRLGVETVAPDDFYKAQKKFILVWRSASLR